MARPRLLDEGSKDCTQKCKPDMGDCLPPYLCSPCCEQPDKEPPQSPPPFYPANSYNSPNHPKFWVTAIVVILATAFFFFTCYTIYRFTSHWLASRRRRQSERRDPDEDDAPDEFMAEEHGPVVDHPIWYIRTVGLDPSVISKITVVKYKRGDGLIDGTDCSVCLSEFQDDETLRLLPKCSHAFHIPCIDTWLRSHTNCPMCRARIAVDTTASVPAPPAAAAVVENPGLVEEINQETVIDSETSDDEASDAQSRAEIPVKIDNECGLDDGVQPVRRSVSMDSMSAAMISAAVADAIHGRRNRDRQLSGEKDAPGGGRVKERNGGINQGLLRLIGSPSVERSMQSGPSAVNRSLSCSAKVFLQRHGSRNRGSILPH